MNTILSNLKDIASSVMYATEARTVNEVLKRIADTSRELVQARYAALGVPDDDGNLKYFEVSGMTHEEIAHIGQLPTGHGLLGVMMTEKQPVRLVNMADDPRAVGLPEGHPDMTSMLGVPIRLGDELYGMLYLSDRLDGQPFSEDDQMLIEMVAGYAALAIVGSQTQAQERRLTLLEERERIGMELHDGVIQSLYAIGMHLELMRSGDTPPRDGDFKQLLYSLDQVIEDIRDYIQDLHARSHQQRTVRECLHEMLTRLCIPETLEIRINAPEQTVPLAPLPYEALCQMVHEALSNVLRHANATVVELTAAQLGGVFQVSIADNGSGFDPHQRDPRQHGGLGLHNIQQRARLHGGKIDIHSEPGVGTEVIIMLPAQTMVLAGVEAAG